MTQGAAMKLKIFRCKSRYAKIFRIFVCSFALALTAALLCMSAVGHVLQGAVYELIKSVGLMMY